MTTGVINEQIQEHMDQLFSSILLEQKKYTKLKGPDEGKENLVAEKLDEYSKMRGKGFFFNYLSSGRGHGPFTELIDGSVKYDLIGGIGPNLLGHSHPQYIKAALESATIDTVMCGNLQTYESPRDLTKSLMDIAGKNSRLKNFWFSGSGSFANDLALKLLWQKQAPKYNLIAFQKAFAGRSIATQDITYNESYRQGMPKSINVHHAPHYDFNDPDNATKKTIDALNEIWNENPGSFCGMMIEIVQGEGGFIFGPRDYYVEIFKWAKEKGIYVWVDEVQTFGRTKELFAFQMLNLEEYVDMVTIGKVLQACGTIYTDELNPKPGLIAGTFNGSIAAINAGKNIIDYLVNGGFYGEEGKINKTHKKFMERFEKLRSGSCKGKIGYSGGVGLMICFEVGDSSKELTSNYVKKLFDNGIVAFFAGQDPTRVRFLAPTCLTDENLDEVFQIIEKTTLEMVK